MCQITPNKKDTCQYMWKHVWLGVRFIIKKKNVVNINAVSPSQVTSSIL